MIVGALGGDFFDFLFSVFRIGPGFGGRRPQIVSSVPVWSQSELVNVGFGPITMKMFRLRKRQGEMMRIPVDLHRFLPRHPTHLFSFYHNPSFTPKTRPEKSTNKQTHGL